jgi:hypothetical protein
MFQGQQPFGFRLGSDLGENAFPHVDLRRHWETIGVDRLAEQPSEVSVSSSVRSGFICGPE